MVVEFLGVGSGLSPELGNTNVLLTSDKSDRQVLIDCGFSTPPELTKRPNGIQSITDVIITHVHSDHVGGLELLGFTSFYVYQNMPDFKKITLHCPTESLKNDIWQILEKGMENAQTVNDGQFVATLETYFDVQVGLDVNIEGFDTIRFKKTLHVEGMEAYSIWLNDKTYYSSDTQELPPEDAELIFQDCQLFESPTSVHTTFGVLNDNMAEKTKSKTWLMHYGFNQNNIDPIDYGFKGFIKRYQKFDL